MNTRSRFVTTLLVATLIVTLPAGALWASPVTVTGQPWRAGAVVPALPAHAPCAPGMAYDPACDVNHDSVIDILDIELTAGHWGQGGSYAETSWLLTGNASTIPGTHFVGTTDNTALYLAVNQQRAFALQPGPSSNPNVVGGSAGNTVTTGIYGATIAGGGDAYDINQVTADYGTVGGGRDNTAGGTAATVPGGESNTAQGNFSFAAGYHARANHAGAFVWADSSGGDFSSTASDQFLVRAHGGVNFDTASALVRVNGNMVWHMGNDGPASGLDADLLDGQQAAAFAPVGHNHDATYVNEGQADSVTSGMVTNGTLQAADLQDGTALTEIADDDGAGSGLDADLLDGQQAAAFAAVGHNHDATYVNEGQADSVTSGMVTNGTLQAADLQDGTALAEITDDDGDGSGLDADMLDGRHVTQLARTTYGTLNSGTVSIEIPHWTPFTLHLASGWPEIAGLAFVQGFENDWAVGVTYIKYNGDGTSAYGGAECMESSTNTLLTFGSGGYTYTLRCPGETTAPHNLVLAVTSGTVELRYTIMY